MHRPGVPAAAAAASPAVAAEQAHVPSSEARKALYTTAREQVPEVEVSVRGVIPSWLDGSLVVNGGGDYSGMTHMFDGYALLAKVRLGGGRAWATQRYVDTKAFAAFKREGRVAIREFGTRPQVSWPLGELRELAQQLIGLATNNPTFTDNASVSLQAVGPPGAPRQLLAMSETPAASYLVNPQDLATLQQVQYDDGVPGTLTTAHPSILADGSLLNFSRTLPFGGMHIYKQDPATLRRTEVAFLADRRPLSPAWLHDFASTERWAVIIEHPLYMNLGSLLLNTPASHLFMDWLPQDEVKVTLVALDGTGETRSFTCPTFFFFHVGNAFESKDGRHLHVDLAGYKDPQILLDLLLQPLVDPELDAAGRLKHQVSPSHYQRLTIPLDPAAAGGRLQAPEQLVRPDPAAAAQHLNALDFCEFPAINPGWRAKPYRYTYCLSAVRPTNMGNALSKLDLEQGTAETWHTAGGAVGEPVFVARPGAAAEDDGVVLAPGVAPDGSSFVVMLDAPSFREVARVELPFGVPNRFHGIWLAGP